MKKIILFFLLAFTFNACLINRVKVSKTLRIVDQTQYVVDTSENPHYLLNYSLESYKNEFVEKLKRRLKKSNVKVVDTSTKMADYTLVLKILYFKDTIGSRTVQDSSSEENGQLFQLHSCSMIAKTILYNSKSELVDSIAMLDEDSETLANNRTFWDFVFHTNKDNSNYRMKTLSNNIFMRLTKGCVRGTARVLVKKLKKY
jgi:hypothetical protein